MSKNNSSEDRIDRKLIFAKNQAESARIEVKKMQERYKIKKKLEKQNKKKNTRYDIF